MGKSRVKKSVKKKSIRKKNSIIPQKIKSLKFKGSGWGVFTYPPKSLIEKKNTIEKQIQKGGWGYMPRF